MKRKLWLPVILACCLCCAMLPASGQNEILLWPNGAPRSEGKIDTETLRVTDQGEHVISNVNKPSIAVFLAPANKNTGVAVIICPGGGHTELWITHEGYNPAKWFAAHGISAFVLKYRLAHAKNSTYSVDTDEVADIQRAIKLVRNVAPEWHIETDKIGVMGFSAGGELAGLAAMRFGFGDPTSKDPIERQNDKPNFQVLIYPGNIHRLEALKSSPPVFIAGGNDDREDISAGMAQLYLKYKQAQVPAELHIYAKVGHGFGMRPTNTGAITEWPQQILFWLTAVGFLKQ